MKRESSRRACFVARTGAIHDVYSSVASCDLVKGYCAGAAAFDGRSHSDFSTVAMESSSTVALEFRHGVIKPRHQWLSSEE
jgi:hypothetical protein